MENVIKDLKHHGWLALPSGVFAANAVWLALVALAYNLGRWTRCCWARPSTASPRPRPCGARCWPGLARRARRVILHGPEHWPWADAVLAALARLRALPAPT